MLQIAVMDIRAGLLQPVRARIRTGEAEHLMASPDEFSNDSGADEAGCTGQKYAHEIPPSGSARSLAREIKLLK
ncbi:hypothetical protein G6F60_015023 [Rhizopus arrhizus]|nr:hypothetical protein G6F60_015023 [Rhizopus arrhizus]